MTKSTQIIYFIVLTVEINLDIVVACRKYYWKQGFPMLYVVNGRGVAMDDAKEARFTAKSLLVIRRAYYVLVLMQAAGTQHDRYRTDPANRTFGM